ncbi:MAG: permease of the major facilitator superfamily [Labilithrix sp.]|nr:permease of the major facilitator superfamily [Labilithrix sp.]
MAGFADLGRALKHRNYRLFFAGQLVSLVGTWMQSVAQSWLVYRLTGSTVLLGLVGFFGQIPVLLVAPLGGALADRFRRHRILLCTQSAAMLLAAILAALTLTGRVQVAHVFVLAASLGIVNAFDIPARQSFVVEMVGREDMVNAIALNSSMVNGARIIGPAIAGITLAAVGEGWCFFVNAVSFLAVIASLLAMRDLPPKKEAPQGSPLANIVEGFRFALRTKPILALLLFLGLVSITGMPYAVLMPVFASDVLHGGPRALGILMGASGAGALTGALLLAARTGFKGLGTWVVASAALFGVSIVAFAFSESFSFSVVLLVPAGAGMMVQMAASNTLVQAMTPDVMRGRVMALYSMMFMGTAPIGALLAGVLAGHIGPARTVALGGAWCIAGAIVFAWRLPKLRPIAREIILGMPLVGGDPDGASTPPPCPDAPDDASATAEA